MSCLFCPVLAPPREGKSAKRNGVHNLLRNGGRIGASGGLHPAAAIARWFTPCWRAGAIGERVF
eukprot:3466236-Lingulodinium_polyedra.AAC.1